MRLQGFPAVIQRRYRCFSMFPEGVSKALAGPAQRFHRASAMCSGEFSSSTKVVPRLSQCIFHITTKLGKSFESLGKNIWGTIEHNWASLGTRFVKPQHPHENLETLAGKPCGCTWPIFEKHKNCIYNNCRTHCIINI